MVHFLLTAAGTWTPLHWACYIGNIDAVLAMIEYSGADLSSRAYKGSTPLEVARLRKHTQLVETALAVLQTKPRWRSVLSTLA